MREICEAFVKMEEFLGKEEIKQFDGCCDTSEYVSGLGVWIQNTIVTDDSPLYQQLRKAGITDKEDMAAFLIDQLWTSRNIENVTV